MAAPTASDLFAATALESLQQLPRAVCAGTSDKALPKAVFKSRATDFQVDEVLPFKADGEGHHLLLHIRKESLNTADVQQALSVLVGCRQSDIGFSGLKDSYAVTTQWFTAPLTTGSENSQRIIKFLKEGCTSACRNWIGEELQARLSGRAGSVEIITLARHQRKLRRGTHQRNRFRTILRDCEGREEFETRLKFIRHIGFPNYFGLQRFGRGASNLRAFHHRWGSTDFRALMASGRKSGRNARGRIRQSDQMAVSAMRSLMFNLYSRTRVIDDSWLTAGLQEPMLVGEGNSFFLNDGSDDTVQERLAAGLLSTSGPLFGELDPSELVLAGRLKKDRDDILCSLDADSPLSLGLDRMLGEAGSTSSGSIFDALGLRHRRRALRRLAHDLTWNWLDPSTLELTFELSASTYATALFHQLGELTDRSGVASGRK